MTLYHWIQLIAVQFIWASSYLFMKIALQELSVGDAWFLRYGLTSVFFFSGWLVRGIPRFQRRDLLLICGVGFLNFFLAQVLQLLALRYTQAADAAIIIVFEPLITVMIAAVLLKERSPSHTWVTLSLAMFGMFLLSAVPEASGGMFSHARMMGNLIFLSSLCCEALCSVSGRVFTKRYSPTSAMALMMVSGFLGGLIFYFPSASPISFESVSLKVWLAILGLSLGCSVFSYTFWFRVIREVPVNYVALSLFLQPLFGSILGIVFLNETIGIVSALGAIIICGSLVWWQVRSFPISRRIEKVS